MNDLSPMQLVLVAILIAIQLTLFVIALVVLLRTPAERLTQPRWVWALVLLVQFAGPIAFFVVGRKPAPAQAQAPQSGNIVNRVVGDLYGTQS